MGRDELLRVLRAFANAKLEYVLIGASAMGFHGLVRATEDLDLFIRAYPPAGEAFMRFARHCARLWRVAPRLYPKGVFRFRSLEDAQAARQRVTQENIDRLRTRR